MSVRQAEAGDGTVIQEGSEVMSAEGDCGVVIEILGRGTGWKCAVDVDFGGETGLIEAHDLKSVLRWP